MPQDDTLSNLAVPAAPAGFLIVGLERRWWAPVQHSAHVGLIDSHTEGTGRHNHAVLVAEKRAQHAATNIRSQAGMVRRGPHTRAEQRAGDELAEPPRGRVDQRGARRISHACSNHCETLSVVPDAPYRELEIGPIERRDDDL